MGTQQQPGGRSYSVAPGRFDPAGTERPDVVRQWTPDPVRIPEPTPIKATPRRTPTVPDTRTYQRILGPALPPKRPAGGAKVILRARKAPKRPPIVKPDRIGRIGGAWLADGTRRNKTDKKGGGGKKGLRGERPDPIGAAGVELVTVADAGFALRRQRRALGQTSDALAEMVGVWPSTIVGIERGRDLKFSRLLWMANKLGLRVVLAAAE